MPVYDLAIIGGGPAGLTAGLYGLGPTSRTVIIERGLYGGQDAEHARDRKLSGSWQS